MKWQHDVAPNDITQASSRIERELETRPDVIGEDYYGDRIYHYGPLAVTYEIRPLDRLVRVIQVSRIKE